MKNCVMSYGLVVLVFVVGVLMISPITGIADEQMKLPPARKIPGLTAEDKFPDGCVDCHINMPHIKKDERVSTLMSKWTVKVEPRLLKKAQAAAPAGLTLKGIHPHVSASLKNIPSACMSCHSTTSRTAPALGALLHLIHLTGGEENHFLTIFQGECTYCHKLNATTGVCTVPSGPEKKGMLMPRKCSKNHTNMRYTGCRKAASGVFSQTSWEGHGESLKIRSLLLSFAC